MFLRALMGARTQKTNLELLFPLLMLLMLLLYDAGLSEVRLHFLLQSGLPHQYPADHGTRIPDDASAFLTPQILFFYCRWHHHAAHRVVGP